MAEITFQLDDRDIRVALFHEGSEVVHEDIAASPQIVTDILQAIQGMLVEHPSAHITETSIIGDLSGSSAMRSVSVIAAMLKIANRGEDLTV